MLHPRYKLLTRPNEPLSLTKNGHLYELESVNFTGHQPDQLEGITRNEISGFSSSSRRRLLDKINSFGRSKPIFVTLGYDDPMPTCMEAKKHLDRFLTKLARHFPGCVTIWRLEFQKAGRVHFHLLIYHQDKQPFIPKEWLQKEWRISTGRPALLPRVEKLRNHRGGLWYCAKYLAKDNDIGWQNYVKEHPQEPPGRFWGIRGASNWKADKQTQKLTNSDYKYLLRSLLEDKAIRSLQRDLIKKGWPWIQIEAKMGLDEWDEEVAERCRLMFQKGGCPTYFYSDKENAVTSKIKRSRGLYSEAEIDAVFPEW
jgi:hypothetical protein